MKNIYRKFFSKNWEILREISQPKKLGDLPAKIFVYLDEKKPNSPTFEFVILNRGNLCNGLFQQLDFAQNLSCFSTKTTEQKNFENYFTDNTFFGVAAFAQKILHLVLIEQFISDFRGKFLR